MSEEIKNETPATESTETAENEAPATEAAAPDYDLLAEAAQSFANDVVKMATDLNLHPSVFISAASAILGSACMMYKDPQLILVANFQSISERMEAAINEEAEEKQDAANSDEPDQESAE